MSEGLRKGSAALSAGKYGLHSTPIQDIVSLLFDEAYQDKLERKAIALLAEFPRIIECDYAGDAARLLTLAMTLGIGSDRCYVALSMYDKVLGELGVANSPRLDEFLKKSMRAYGDGYGLFMSPKATRNGY